MKKYCLYLLLPILVLEVFQAAVDELADEDTSERNGPHHHCFRKNYTICLKQFSDGVEELQEKYKDKKDASQEVAKNLGPLQEAAYSCLNETIAESKFCPSGMDQCMIATFIFTDNTTLHTEGCDSKTATTCFSFLSRENYEYYTGKTAQTIKCDFCDGIDCNGYDENGLFGFIFKRMLG